MINLDEYKIYRDIMCIDLKSFYASVECVDMGVDPFKTPVVVADKERGGGSIVLAVSPFLRAKGVPSRLRIFELPKNEKIIFCKPRMRRYLKASADVVSIFLRYVSQEDIHIYSVDESFLDFTSYRKLYKMSMHDLAKQIKDDIYNELGLTATAGIGPNMLLAKLSMDIEAKKTPDGIAEWGYDDVEEKLYPVTPLSKMWGIGSRYEIHLNNMGVYKIGDIAALDPMVMKKKFGVIGEELWFHVHGIDMSVISEKKKYKTMSKSYAVGQVLFQDYYRHTAPELFLEMSDDLSTRLRETGMKSSVVHLTLMYNKEYQNSGISHQIKLGSPIKLGSEIYDTLMLIFNKYYHDEPIRGIHISLSGLVRQTDSQLNLFESRETKEKEEKLFACLDEIKRKHGRNSVRRASTEFEYSTAKARNSQVGGHHE